MLALNNLKIVKKDCIHNSIKKNKIGINTQRKCKHFTIKTIKIDESNQRFK